MRPCSGCRARREAGLIPLLQGRSRSAQSAQQPPHTKVLHGTPAANWVPGASIKLHVLFAAGQPPKSDQDTVRMGRASNKGLRHAAQLAKELAPHWQPEEHFLICSETLTVLTRHSPARPLPGSGTCGCLKHTEPVSSRHPARPSCLPGSWQGTTRLSWAQQSREQSPAWTAGMTVTSVSLSPSPVHPRQRDLLLYQE